ncbi:MAG TPA: hypothetical protein VFX21_16250 [Acidimicrobiia bacterium]|nr:hypothetical protein [Acidimicrobiia bacterium]
MPRIPVVSAAAERVREFADSLLVQGRTTVTEVVDNVRIRIEVLPTMPTAMVDELRRHLNMSELATKDDVEHESRMAGRRIATLMESFVAEQRARDDALLESVRNEIREELNGYSEAAKDGVGVDFGDVGALDYDDDEADELDLEELSSFDGLDDEDDETFAV